jgi:hypothetical protein
MRLASQEHGRLGEITLMKTLQSGPDTRRFGHAYWIYR